MAQSIYRPGTPVWLVDREQGWLPGEVKSFSTTDSGLPVVQVKDEDGQEITLKATFKDATAEEGGLPPLRNTAEFGTIKDLTRLPHLNEPSILEVIRNRYADRCLYTYSGIVLIAVNPFSDMSAYYAPDVIRSYIGRNRDELDPHLFAVAEEAFSTMDRTGKAQSIIVSGESGSGKTESAKYIMRYLASVHARESLGPHTSGVSIEQQILATNPILEAFGNAKTARNDNSSRFGKYIQILFDAHQHIVGARIRTYLLERSRVTFQQSAERNYHIFYQLCAGANDEERQELGLDADVTGFRYLCGMPSDPAQTSYAQDFAATCEALEVIGIDAGKRRAIFQLLAGLLHMGNMTIRSKRDTKDATMDEEDAALLRAAQLLGIDAKGFSKCTTTKQIDARGEKFSAARTVAQAAGVRDGVVQYIYSCLFNWLVARVNEGLSSGKEDLEATFIAVLDIYGFEQFEKNSFEQFCINYANEKLQQQFLSHVFKLDQAEYVEEGIPWNAIEFPDNQPCITLIEGKIGIISLLDEESRLAAGTDTTFVDKLNSQLKTPANKAVFKDHLHGNTAFKIVHYAGDVAYSVDGFLEKNRGIVPEEHLALLAESTNDFLREVLEDGTVSATADAGKDDASSVVAAPKKGSNRKPTQASVFKSSLILLMRTLDQTDMHYIRCIKPNEDKQPWEFQNAHVLDQLRACGVLETVKISRAGYPSRMTYEEFVARYTLLLPRHVTRPYLRDPQRLTAVILQRTVGGGDKYQTGRTKIFLRARVLPILEGMRIEKQTSAILKVQSAARGTMARKRFRKARTEARAASEAKAAEKAAAAKAKEAEDAARRDTSPPGRVSISTKPPASPPSSYPAGATGGSALQPDEDAPPERPSSRLMRRLSSQSHTVGRVLSMVIRDRPTDQDEPEHPKPPKREKRSKSRTRPKSRARDRSPEKATQPTLEVPPPAPEKERRSRSRNEDRPKSPRHASPKAGKRKKFSPALLFKSKSWKDLRSGGRKSTEEAPPMRRSLSHKRTRRSVETKPAQDLGPPPELKIYNRFMRQKDEAVKADQGA